MPLRRLSRKWLKQSLLAIFVAVLGATALGILLLEEEAARRLPPAGRETDPTRRGPERTLALDSVRLEPSPLSGKLHLRGHVRTNLIAGARIRVEVIGLEALVGGVAAVANGVAEVDLEGAGAVTQGRYRVVATFALEEQPEPVARGLAYQPRRLDASATLDVPADERARRLRSQLEQLLQDVNSQDGPSRLGELARRSQALEESLWISGLVPAVRRLRRAIEQAQAESPRFDVERLRRAAVDAQVLASFAS